MIITDETKAMAQNIVDYIDANPDNHDQGAFWCPKDANDYGKLDVQICDTTMCIAGTAVFLSGGVEALREHERDGDWSSSAAPLLGLNNYERNQLFFEIMDENAAVDAVRAIANGDETKFHHILESYKVE